MFCFWQMNWEISHMYMSTSCWCILCTQSTVSSLHTHNNHRLLVGPSFWAFVKNRTFRSYSLFYCGVQQYTQWTIIQIVKVPYPCNNNIIKIYYVSLLLMPLHNACHRHHYGMQQCFLVWFTLQRNQESYFLHTPTFLISFYTRTNYHFELWFWFCSPI